MRQIMGVEVVEMWENLGEFKTSFSIIYFFDLFYIEFMPFSRSY